MSNMVQIIGFGPALIAEADRDAAVESLHAAALKLPGITDCIVSRTNGQGINAKDVVWRARFEREGGAKAAFESARWAQDIAPLFAEDGPLTVHNHLRYGAGRGGGDPLKSGLLRISLFHGDINPTPERLRQFADELAAMPAVVPAIRRWQLAEPEIVEGQGWSVVWEQEFDDLQGLNGPYLMHPSHWAQVDRWFDPEYPEWLIDPALCHAYCEFRRH